MTEVNSIRCILSNGYALSNKAPSFIEMLMALKLGMSSKKSIMGDLSTQSTL